MPYNNIVDRTKVAAGITVDVDESFLETVQQESAALQLIRRVPVRKKQVRFPVKSAMPVAYFVNGDTGLKQTTDFSWDNVYMNVEEIATIVVVPDAVDDDLDENIFDTIKPDLVTAVGRCLDGAVFFGINKPAVWPDAIVPAAIAAGNVVDVGHTASEGGIAQDVLDTMAKVEEDEYDVDGFVAARNIRAALRSARDNTGQRLLDIASLTEIEGAPVAYSMPGLWPTGAGAARLIAMQSAGFRLGIRQDITFTVADQAVIQDANGAIVHNTFQQDSKALRVVFRVGWVQANDAIAGVSNTDRYPAAVLRTAP